MISRNHKSKRYNYLTSALVLMIYLNFLTITNISELTERADNNFRIIYLSLINNQRSWEISTSKRKEHNYNSAAQCVLHLKAKPEG